MSFKIRKSNTLSVGLFFLYVTSTIAFATTTVATDVLFDAIRLTSAALTVLCFVLGATRSKFQKKQAYSLLLFIGLMMHGLILAFINGIDMKYLLPLPLNAAIILTFLMYFSSRNHEVFGPSLVWFIILYILAILSYTLASGGLTIGFPPTFHYGYLTSKLGTEYDIQYSQGATKFYGLASILSSYLFFISFGLRKLTLSLTAIIFIILMIIGGARGDSAASMLIILILAFVRYRQYTIFFIIAGVPLTIFAIGDQFAELVLFDRFQRITTDFDVRALLLVQALEILSTRTDCLVIGCGFNFFQHNYGFDISRYPHNFMVEMILVFGLPVTATLLALAIKGFRKHLRTNGFLGDAFIPIFMFFFLIGLKSGSILFSWFLFAGFVYFAATAFAGTEKAKHN